MAKNKVAGTARLDFDPALNQLDPDDKDRQLRHALSATVRIGDTLWVANDETVRLERLVFKGTSKAGKYVFGDHKVFPLGDYFPLAADPSEEADIEGLDYQDEYLWIVGSHSRKRAKVRKKDSLEARLTKLRTVTSDGNRFLLARIPMVMGDDGHSLDDGTGELAGGRKPARLRGGASGNDLTEALRKDPHLKHFLPIPGKDNGFDIEGLALAGSRVFVGLRGPVLRGWAVILELEVGPDPDNQSELRLKPLDPPGSAGPMYRKHFLELEGLGIRDLCVQGTDLLILAGPSMDLDGPVRIYRWKGGAQPAGETALSQKELASDPVTVPFGEGDDHPEGMTLFSLGEGEPDSVLVVYDSAAAGRLESGKSSVTADIIAL